jgi:hypothetical protein
MLSPSSVRGVQLLGDIIDLLGQLESRQCTEVERKRPEPLSSRRKNSVTDCWRQRWHTQFTNAGGRRRRSDDVYLDLGHFAHARRLVVVEIAVSSNMV